MGAVWDRKHIHFYTVWEDFQRIVWIRGSKASRAWSLSLMYKSSRLSWNSEWNRVIFFQGFSCCTSNKHCRCYGFFSFLCAGIVLNCNCSFILSRCVCLCVCSEQHGEPGMPGSPSLQRPTVQRSDTSPEFLHGAEPLLRNRDKGTIWSSVPLGAWAPAEMKAERLVENDFLVVASTFNFLNWFSPPRRGKGLQTQN